MHARSINASTPFPFKILGVDVLCRKRHQQPGFLGVESVRGADGFGITVSYWESEDAIQCWKAHSEHKFAQQAGKRVWYANLIPRVAKVERAYGKALTNAK
jgi:heme-degrading monooxygenase HmoA